MVGRCWGSVDWYHSLSLAIDHSLLYLYNSLIFALSSVLRVGIGVNGWGMREFM